MSMDAQNVVVIGAGTMGNGIAHVFAQSGHTVTLVDVNAAALERATETIGRNLDRLVAKARITAQIKADTLDRLTTSTEMHGAVSNADLVVEAATERVDLKLQIFEQLDKAAPAHAILANQHIEHLHHEDCGGHPARFSGDWNALHEPCSHHETGGSHSGLRHKR